MEAILKNYFHDRSTQLLALSYASAGLLGTAIHYTVFFVLLSTLKASPMRPTSNPIQVEMMASDATGAAVESTM